MNMIPHSFFRYFQAVNEFFTRSELTYPSLHSSEKLDGVPNNLSFLKNLRNGFWCWCHHLMPSYFIAMECSQAYETVPGYCKQDLILILQMSSGVTEVLAFPFQSVLQQTLKHWQSFESFNVPLFYCCIGQAGSLWEVHPTLVCLALVCNAVYNVKQQFRSFELACVALLFGLTFLEQAVQTSSCNSPFLEWVDNVHWKLYVFLHAKDFMDRSVRVSF